MQDLLKSKTILFITPRFYGYENIIIEQLKKHGASVKFFAERENNLSYKMAGRKGNEALAIYQKKYYLNIYDNIKDLEFDYVFIIRGFLMPVEFIDNLHTRYPQAILIMHQWDSMKNNNYERFLKKFDKLFSFDPVDCKTYPELKYLPNFYYPAFADLCNDKIIYNISFIGWAYESRIRLIRKLKKQVPQLSFFCYLYIPFLSYIKELIKGVFLRNIKFTPVSFQKVVQITRSSFCVLDIADENQSGYTYRAIDAMAAGKKLITTNSFIQAEGFYNENNILIIDRNHPKIDIGFFKNPFVPVNVEAYSLDNWIEQIFVK